MKTIYSIAAVTIAVLAAVSCRNKEEQLPLTPEITLSGDTLIDAAGGTLTFALVSNVPWTAATDQKWCMVAPAGGDAGECALRVTAQANDSEEVRTAEIIVSSAAEDWSRSVRIVQKGVLVLDMLTVEHTGNSFMAPIVTAESLEDAVIMWGDGTQEDYSPDAEHVYGAEGLYETVVAADGIEQITVRSLKGVSRISLSTED